MSSNSSCACRSSDSPTGRNGCCSSSSSSKSCSKQGTRSRSLRPHTAAARFHHNTNSIKEHAPLPPLSRHTRTVLAPLCGQIPQHRRLPILAVLLSPLHNQWRRHCAPSAHKCPPCHRPLVSHPRRSSTTSTPRQHVFARPARHASLPRPPALSPSNPGCAPCSAAQVHPLDAHIAPSPSHPQAPALPSTITLPPRQQLQPQLAIPMLSRSSCNCSSSSSSSSSKEM
mmetsp:Transcript_9819/g.25137  ORF Transcript_9819/g.25137 Transcript_9819/m.25137 type:complete len:227 (+) Transcript_9819:6591-7271(+)